MSHARFIIGDTRDVTATLPDNSVDLILSSPPFLALRSYLPDDHPDKDREIGSEATPAAFIDVLLELTAEWERVLAPHGSICVELGDTYSGSGGAGGDYNPTGWRDGQPVFGGSANGKRLSRREGMQGQGGPPRKTITDGWPLAKSACLIPELYRVALAYGINPLTGQPSPAGRWRIRNTVRWARPNPPVGALGDKFRPATSDMVVACKASDRWFDLDAVRQPYSENTNARTAQGVERQQRTAKTSPDGNRDTLDDMNNNGAGAPPLDWWNIPTQPYKGSHYATWPAKLCEIPIQSMCPREVCTECGEPRRRITEFAGLIDANGNEVETEVWSSGIKDGKGAHSNKKSSGTTTTTTIGWTVCECPTPVYRPGVVFDPFAGSGTTLAVATGHGRDAIGIDLDERNADLARERVGMFLTIGTHEVNT